MASKPRRSRARDSGSVEVAPGDPNDAPTLRLQPSVALAVFLECAIVCRAPGASIELGDHALLSPRTVRLISGAFKAQRERWSPARARPARRTNRRKRSSRPLRERSTGKAREALQSRPDELRAAAASPSLDRPPPVTVPAVGRRNSASRIALVRIPTVPHPQQYRTSVRATQVTGIPSRTVDFVGQQRCVR